MIFDKKVIAIIPARGGSKGLPGKNIKEMCGKPLIAWPIETAKNSLYVDKVLVTTDDQMIADVAKKHGAEVPFLRPNELALDTSPSSDAIIHALDYLECNETFDYIVVLEATSPLTEVKDIDSALLQLYNSDCSSIVGISSVEDSHPDFCVTKSQDNKISNYTKAKFDNPKRRQDLSKIYCFDGTLYISEVGKYRESRTFYHEKTLGYTCESWKRYEIDDIVDFIIIEAIMRNKHLLSK